MSAAAIHAVRQEYTNTVLPAKQALQESLRLERQLGDLVNQTYGLTPGEVRLMWETAPPRMPLTSEAEDRSQVDVEAVA